MSNERVKNIVTVIALLLCILAITLTIIIVKQHNTLVSTNIILTEQVKALQGSLDRMSDSYAKAVNDESTTTFRIKEVRKKMESMRIHLLSAKKMLGLYKASEEKAVATYIKSKYKNIPIDTINDIAVNTLKVANEEKIPIGLLVAVMDQESGFNPTVVSSSGARGLMQVMPFWAKKFDFIKNIAQLHDIYTGIKAGARILRYALDKSGGSIRKALSLYKGPNHNDYVNHVIKLMGDYEVHREFIMRPVRSVLQKYYTSNSTESDLS